MRSRAGSVAAGSARPSGIRPGRRRAGSIGRRAGWSTGWRSCTPPRSSRPGSSTCGGSRSCCVRRRRSARCSSSAARRSSTRRPRSRPLLAEATPDVVTRVAAVEPDQNWLLMFDHGEATLGDGPPEAWAPGLEVHAGIQQAWIGREQALIDAGAPVRSVAALAEALPTTGRPGAAGRRADRRRPSGLDRFDRRLHRCLRASRRPRARADPHPRRLPPVERRRDTGHAHASSTGPMPPSATRSWTSRCTRPARRTWPFGTHSATPTWRAGPGTCPPRTWPRRASSRSSSGRCSRCSRTSGSSRASIRTTAATSRAPPAPGPMRRSRRLTDGIDLRRVGHADG